MPQACLGSSWVTVYIWLSSGKFPPSRRGRTPRRMAWPSLKWARCATSTSSSRSRSCRASSSWGMAWRSSGGPTEVGGCGAGVIKVRKDGLLNCTLLDFHYCQEQEKMSLWSTVEPISRWMSYPHTSSLKLINLSSFLSSLCLLRV